MKKAVNKTLYTTKKIIDKISYPFSKYKAKEFVDDSKLIVPKRAGKGRVGSSLDYSYEDDELFTALRYTSSKYNKSVAVIHFSWTTTLEQLSNYFSKSIERSANSTWGVGKDGTCHRYLPDIGNPSWTQGVRWTEQGGFIDHNGKDMKNVNNIACSFEVVNRNYEPFTEAQYKAVVTRILWMLKVFPDFRLWLVTGHEQIIPFVKDDPGKKWDWRKFFQMCGVRKDFYDEYLIYLEETSSYATCRDKTRSDRKWAEVKDGVAKIKSDLIGKPKNYCL